MSQGSAPTRSRASTRSRLRCSTIRCGAAAHNDTFTGLGGNDFIDGRGGFDTVSYNNIYLSTGGVSVDLAAGTATGDASIGTDTLRSIEGIQGTNAADTFVATGMASPGALNIGNNGTFNQFEGLGGDDTITGNGNTRIVYYNATAGVTITFGLNSWTGTSGDASGTRLAIRPLAPTPSAGI